MHKKLIIKKIFFLLLIPYLVDGQISFLDEKNGYKDIKLGTDVRDYDYINKAEDNESLILSWTFAGKLMYERHLAPSRGAYVVDLTKIKSPHPFYLTKVIWIETYNNLISGIIIIVDESGSQGYTTKGVYREFVKLLGPPNWMDFSGGQPGLLETTTATWIAEKVRLGLQSIHNIGKSPVINGVPYYFLEDKRRIAWKISYYDKELHHKKLQEEDNQRMKRKEKELKKLKEKF